MGVFTTARSSASATCSSKPSVSHRRRWSRPAKDSPRACQSSRATRWSWLSLSLLVGSRRRRQCLRLLRIRAEVDDRTDRAEWSRPAHAATVENEAPRHPDPVLLRVDRPETRLDVRARAVESKPLGDASHMAVDGHRRYPKGRSKDDRCRLATDSMKAREPVHVGRDLATELVEEPACHRA